MDTVSSQDNNKIQKQLANYKLPYGVKISANLLDIKPIHANWIIATPSWVERNDNNLL